MSFDRQTPLAIGGRILTGLTLAGGVLLASACEPTAFISQQIHDFQEIYSTGAIGNECTETSAEVRPVLHFTLVDTNNAFIFPGDELGQFRMELGNTFTPDNLSIQGSTGVLFPAPDVDCGEGATIGTACPDPVLSAAGFSCQPIDATAPSGDSQARIVCALPEFRVEISPNAEVGFTGQEQRRRAVIALVSNGASLLGINEAGVPDRLNCSADPLDRRTRALSLMLRELAGEGNPYVSGTRMCVASFEGQTEPDYKVPAGGALDECFQTVSEGSNGFAFLSDAIDTMGTNEGPGGRNPWAAIEDACNRFNEWIGSDFERHLVVFTDGDLSPDVVETAGALGQNFDAAMQAALNNEVTVHIVQLDRRDRGGNCNPPTAHGALEEYSRLACATGGDYAFIEDAADLPGYFTNLGRTIPGHYELQLVAEQLATLPLGPYKVAFALNTTVDDNTDTYVFSALAGSGGGNSGRQDTRMSMINRGNCAEDSRVCMTGYICDATRQTCHTPVPDPNATEGSGEGSGEGGPTGE